ncbi:flagellin [Limimaricola litoreus]|uniref:Flagellin n=1 Tax=Limimaricola litoreus TaxID=2955316 RepID=A0A9X2FQC1_9RHOB|nr:flagellin [Limimaricola litoreus]MCP1169232.1 flagellin [Limimaricola litoreus]
MISTTMTATLQSSLTSRRNISDLSQRLDKAGQEVSTGKHAEMYRALGPRSAETLAVRSQLTRLEGFVQSNNALARKLESGSSALNDIRASAQAVITEALQAGSSGQITGTLQLSAQMALDQIIGAANRSHAGEALFSGIETDRAPLQPFDEANPASGQSPREMVEAVIGTGPASAAEAETMAEALAEAFAPTTGDFEGSFYNGTPAATPDRLSARIDENETLSYGVQANDPGFTELLRGLSMLASADVSQFDNEGAAQAWLNEAITAMAGGRDALLQAETRLGAQQARLESVMEAQAAKRDLYTGQINAIENVDPYEAATRLTELQTQLEASYMVTSRLSKLSFLNYL